MLQAIKLLTFSIYANIISYFFMNCQENFENIINKKSYIVGRKENLWILESQKFLKPSCRQWI